MPSSRRAPRSMATRRPTRRPSTRPPRSSRCCPRSCRPTSPPLARARSAWRWSSRWWSAPTARSRRQTSIVPSWSIARSSPTTTSPPGSTALRPRRRPYQQSPGSISRSYVQDRAAQAMRGLRHRHGALSLETIEARPVFDGDVRTGLQADEVPRGEGLPVAAPGPALARALGADRGIGGVPRRTLAVRATRTGAR